jgi:uncharacterized membrane protein YhhN
MPLAISLAVIVSASVTIAAVYLRPVRRRLFHFFKPLTTVLILLIALLPGTVLPDRYAGGICLGLIFSLAGDILLMLPRDRFRQGLAAFLLARICYLFVFASGAAAPSFPWLLLLFAIIGATSLAYLWPALPGRLKAAVSLYIAVTVLMTAMAAALLVVLPAEDTLAVAIGAVLFMISDLILAIDRFRRPFHLAHALVLATYFAGQLLIALSVGLRAWSPR